MSTASIRYIVDDVDAAVTFYTEILGFGVEMNPAPGFAMLRRGNLRLLLNEPGSGGGGVASGASDAPEPGGWNRLQLSVEQVASEKRRLDSAGVPTRGGVVHGRGGAQLLVEDPAGNVVELFQRPDDRVEPIPEGFHAVTPFITCDAVDKLADFIVRAFGGREWYRMTSDDGVARHAVVEIGESPIMLSSGTELYGTTWSAVHLFVEDVDATYEQATAAGAGSIRAPEDQFYGDRSAGVEDPWGNQWWLATHIEDVPPEEMKRREKRFREGNGSATG